VSEAGGGKRVGFLVAGAQKAGTTALFDYLAELPELELPAVKEAHFFDDEENVDWRAPDYAPYHALFGDPARLWGEATPIYLYWPNALERIRAYNPAIKLILLFRDPIERAYSHFGLNLKVGFETLSDFESAVSAESDPRRQQYGIRFAYSGASLYHDRLRGFWTRFPRERILVLLFQDFAADPAGTMRRVYDFLAVDPRFTPDVAVRHNRSMTPRGSLVREAFGRQRRLRRFLQRNLPPRLVTRIGDVIMRPPPGLTPEVRERLLPRFDAEIQRLEALLDRDLSAWRSAQA